MRVHEGPVARCEVLRANQTRRQLQDRVAEVVGGRRRPVPRGDPDVPRPVDLGRGAAHPHGPVVADRHGLVVTRRPAALGYRADPAAVGRAVAVVAPVAEHDVPVAEIQAGPLQDRRRGLSGRIHGLAQQCRAGVHVQSDQDVGRRASAEFVGDREDLPPGDVEHRGPGDADRRADVAAGQITGRNRCPDVAGPQDGTGIGGQGIHRVVLRRDIDATGGFEGLSVDLPVERGRGPCGGRRREGDARRVDPGSERVAVVDGPRCGGVDVWRGCARARSANGADDARRARGENEQADGRADREASAPQAMRRPRSPARPRMEPSWSVECPHRNRLGHGCRRAL